MSAPKQNQNAVKGEADRASSVLGPFRIQPRRKAAYVRAARGQKLTEWVFDKLDQASGYHEPTHTKEPTPTPIPASSSPAAA